MNFPITIIVPNLSSTSTICKTGRTSKKRMIGKTGQTGETCGRTVKSCQTDDQHELPNNVHCS